MKKYLIRLDDACEWRDIKRWERIEELFEKYSVKPLVGIIPKCEDESLLTYPYDNFFWVVVKRWISKGWTIAMHGYNHVYISSVGGLNPVNKRSEFAGVAIEAQKEKIKNGVFIMRNHDIEPRIFFAPSHTFDNNTIIAIKEESNINIISDTIASKPYCYKGLTFIPQQSGRVRKLPFNTITFCYHPNSMTDDDFNRLESFLKKHKISEFPIINSFRKKSLFDKFLSFVYFAIRKNK